jgi:hypothetical protein
MEGDCPSTVSIVNYVSSGLPLVKVVVRAIEDVMRGQPIGENFTSNMEKFLTRQVVGPSLSGFLDTFASFYEVSITTLG